MDKMLLINNGMKFQGYLFAKALSKHYDVEIMGNPSDTMYEYDIDEEWYAKHKTDGINIETKIVFGLDQGTIPIVRHIRKHSPFELFCGVQILDYPAHVFRPTKNFNQSVLDRWRDDYIPGLFDLDFTIHNQMNSLNYLGKHLNGHGEHSFIKYPVNPITFERKPKNQVVYSGRIHPDKGLHHVISAISMIDRKDKPKLVVIGNGYDFSSFAEHLGVEYEWIKNCDEKDKWKIYSESKAVVCGADNPYIPALCILEGISVGIPGVCFNTTENHLHYQDFAYYIQCLDIEAMSQTIDHLCRGTYADRTEGGIEYYKKECTYEAWASKAKETIDEHRQ